MDNFTLRVDSDWVKVERVDGDLPGWLVKIPTNPAGAFYSRVDSIADQHAMWYRLNEEQRGRVRTEGWLGVCADEASIVYIALREVRPWLAPEKNARDVLNRLKSEQESILQELNHIDLAYYADHGGRGIIPRLEQLFRDFTDRRGLMDAVRHAGETRQIISRLHAWQSPLTVPQGASV